MFKKFHTFGIIKNRKGNFSAVFEFNGIIVVVHVCEHHHPVFARRSCNGICRRQQKRAWIYAEVVERHSIEGGVNQRENMCVFSLNLCSNFGVVLLMRIGESQGNNLLVLDIWSEYFTDDRFEVGFEPFFRVDAW